MKAENLPLILLLMALAIWLLCAVCGCAPIAESPWLVADSFRHNPKAPKNWGDIK